HVSRLPGRRPRLRPPLPPRAVVRAATPPHGAPVERHSGRTRPLPRRPQLGGGLRPRAARGGLLGREHHGGVDGARGPHSLRENMTNRARVTASLLLLAVVAFGAGCGLVGWAGGPPTGTRQAAA